MQNRPVRLDSSANSDVESATDVLVSKKTARVFCVGNVPSREELSAIEKGRITMTKQWSIGVNTPK
jgi:hypothetical protein